MNIWGGLTFFVHLIIILVHWIIKKPIHFIIILLVFVLFFVQFIFLWKNSLKDNNLSYISANVLNNDIKSNDTNFKIENNIICDSLVEIDPNKKYIIFMMDDLESLYLRPVSTKIISDSINKKIPFTVWVTPLNIKYDFQLATFLNQHRCNLELAQHWFNNREDIPEFQDLPEWIAYDKLQEWLDILYNFTDKKIITFIAPNGNYSEWTKDAVKKSDFKIITGKWDAFFDYSDLVFDSNGSFDINTIVNKSIKNASIKWFSIIMIHPKDYIDKYWEFDSDKYNNYLDLIDELDSKWFSFTTMYWYYDYLYKNWLKTDFFDKNVILPEYKDKIVNSWVFGKW